MEDRHGSRSALITSQLAVMDWHSEIGAATPADAILYRLTHNSHRIVLKDTSMLAIVAHGERPKSVKLFTSGDIAAFAHSRIRAFALRGYHLGPEHMISFAGIRNWPSLQIFTRIAGILSLRSMPSNETLHL